MDHHQIHEHMEVLGSDGKHIGTVVDEKVHLAKTTLEAIAQWETEHAQPQQQGGQAQAGKARKVKQTKQ